MDEPLRQERTTDIISDVLSITQHKKGYRFGLDALLLATDLPVDLTSDATVMELGSGQGAVGLSVAARGAAQRVILVERNPSMLELLRLNVEQNQELIGSVGVVVEAVDLRDHREQLTSHCANLVLCNPPYFPLGQRRVSQNEERADAHHERHGTLMDFFRAATYCLTHRGWLKMILPPWRLGDVTGGALPGDLKLCSLRFIHAEPGAPAYLMEVVCRRGSAPDLEVRAPLLVRGEDGFYSPEVARRVASAARAVACSEAQIEAVRLASDKRRGM